MTGRQTTISRHPAGDEADAGKYRVAKFPQDAETGDPAVKKLTPRAFSARISQRDDWKPCRHREGGDKCTRLYRTNGCPCDQQSSFE